MALGLKEQIEMVSEAWEGMPGFGDVASSIGSSFGRSVRGISGKVTKKLEDVSHKKDDGVVVPEGTKTLIGEDFQSLYGGKVKSGEATFTDAGGWQTQCNCIEGDTGYGTEMMFSSLKREGDVRASVTALEPEQRAAYEVVLLTKLAASQYQEGAAMSNDAVAEDYASKMALYRQACEGMGVSWEHVVEYASWELQCESLAYREDAKDMLGAQASEDNRVLSNRAHAMLLECAPEGYEDTLLPDIAGEITMEETLDTSRQTVNFLVNIGTWFKEKWEGLKEAVTSPFRAMKEAVPGLIDSADQISEWGKSEAARDMEMYREAGAGIQEKYDEAREKAGEAVQRGYEWLSGEDSGEQSDEAQNDGMGL